jgi:hypothetical protein
LNAGEAHIYELGLRDGENCLLVEGGDWSAAVRRALAMPLPEIVRMRTHLHRLNVSQLQYDPLSRGICDRLGVHS